MPKNNAVQALFDQLKAAGWEEGHTQVPTVLENRIVWLEDKRPYGPSIKFYFRDGQPCGFQVVGQTESYYA